jgi:hypothetical protein
MRFALVFALALICGCSALERNPATTQLVTQYAVAKYLEQRPDTQARYESAQRIIRVATQLRATTGEQTATLATLRPIVQGLIERQSISPADRVAAYALTEILFGEVESRIKAGTMVGSESVLVEQVLAWVVSVAATVPRA